MTKEVLELALEALEVYWGKAEHRRTKEDESKAVEAITAIKEALAQPVQEPIDEFAIRADERKACAKVCDVLAVHPEYASEVTKLAALAIRARGQA